jgi:hypothetical protein
MWDTAGLPLKLFQASQIYSVPGSKTFRFQYKIQPNLLPSCVITGVAQQR